MVRALPDGLSGHAQAGFETSTLHIHVQAHTCISLMTFTLLVRTPHSPHVEEGQHAFLGPVENTHRVSPDDLQQRSSALSEQEWAPGSSRIESAPVQTRCDLWPIVEHRQSQHHWTRQSPQINTLVYAGPSIVAVGAH